MNTPPNYDEKIEAARAWMEARRIPQLGTEHLKPKADSWRTEAQNAS